MGLAAGGTGVVALFVSSNDVASAVLLVIGAIFLLMATTGHPITSAKFGQNEIRLAQRVKREIQAVIDSAPEEVRPELASAVIESGLPRDDPLRATADRIVSEAQTYEAEVARAVLRVGLTIEARDPGALGVDLVGMFDGVKIAVEVKSVYRPLSASAAMTALYGASKFFDVTPPPRGLLIVARAISASAKNALERSSPRSTATVWQSEDDDEALGQALRALALIARGNGLGDST